jgi:hypothetical protein
MCENARALFWGVNFSHVDAISDDFAHRIRLLSILRDEQNEFSHSLGRSATALPAADRGSAQPVALAHFPAQK